MKIDSTHFLAALLATSVVLAQDVPVFRATTTLVTVPSVVTDEHGRAIPGLRVDDFRLYVDGVRQKIDNLRTEADLPLLLGVINDVSDSQRNRVSEKERAITQLLEGAIHGQDRAFVVAVNDEVMLKSEVSGGSYGLRYRLLAQGGEPLGVPCGALGGEHGRKRPVCGGTALWNAVYASAHLKLSGRDGNKALLILSDGNDTGSTHSFSEALEEVQRSGAVVYAIRYPDALSTGAATDSSDELRRLTEETGGLLFEPHGVGWAEIVARIAADLRGRYVLGFRPESAPGSTTGGDIGRRLLRVEVSRPGVMVRARREYVGP